MSGGTAMHTAALSGAVACFQLCLSAARAASLASVPPIPLDPGSRTAAGRTLMHLAVLSGSPEMVAAVAAAGCPLDAPAADMIPHDVPFTPFSVSYRRASSCCPHCPHLLAPRLHLLPPSAPPQEAIRLHDEAMVAALLAVGARPEARDVLQAVDRGVSEPVLRQLAAAGTPFDGGKPEGVIICAA